MLSKVTKFIVSNVYIGKLPQPFDCKHFTMLVCTAAGPIDHWEEPA
jgi:hypothetical protein